MAHYNETSVTCSCSNVVSQRDFVAGSRFFKGTHTVGCSIVNDALTFKVTSLVNVSNNVVVYGHIGNSLHSKANGLETEQNRIVNTDVC